MPARCVTQDNTCIWLKPGLLLSLCSSLSTPRRLIISLECGANSSRRMPLHGLSSGSIAHFIVLRPFTHFRRHMFPRIFAQLKSIKLHFRLNELERAGSPLNSGSRLSRHRKSFAMNFQSLFIIFPHSFFVPTFPGIYCFFAGLLWRLNYYFLVFSYAL